MPQGENGASLPKGWRAGSLALLRARVPPCNRPQTLHGADTIQSITGHPPVLNLTYYQKPFGKISDIYCPGLI